MIKNIPLSEEMLLSLPQFIQLYESQIQTFQYLLLLINVLLHLLFASAVAKDAGRLYRLGQRPALVSGASWAFATLIGGVITATIYWFIHHSTLTRTGFETTLTQK